MKDQYRKDDTGQWWYYNISRGNRYRVPEHICNKCGISFPDRHKQKFCSAKCRTESQKGILRKTRLPKSCAWCKKEFTTKKVSQSAKCCSKRCAYDLGNTKRGRVGSLNPRWKGGVRSHSRGYIRQYVEGRGCLLQHRVVMENILGRRLLPKENIHHKNGIRSDNRPENLELWTIHQPPGQRYNEQQHCKTCACFKIESVQDVQG